MFARNCFQKLDAKDLNITIKLDKSVAVREAANTVDVVGGQGFMKCNCGTQCNSKRCACRKEIVFCNSRCRSSNKKCLNLIKMIYIFTVINQYYYRYLLKIEFLINKFNFFKLFTQKIKKLVNKQKIFFLFCFYYFITGLVFGQITNFFFLR